MSSLSDLGTFLKGEREGVTLELDSKLNAIVPYSGYLAVSKKLDNFYFQTSSSFIASMADKSRYVKFLDKVVDTWSAVIQTTSTQTANATATTLTMSNTTGLTVGKVVAILKGNLLVHTSVITAVSTNVSITVLTSFNREATAYKIKIIQSINLNDYVPEVLVQDESTNGLTLQTSVNAGDYVVVDRIVQSGAETYRAKRDAPIGTSLTDTTYFETRDSIGVTNQIGVFHKYNILTNSYEGLSAEILFSDVTKEDLLDNPAWLARNGFSKAGEYCYSKGAYLYLPVSIWQTLNKGAYHEFLNKFGTGTLEYIGIPTASRVWYNSNAVKITSLAEAYIYKSKEVGYGTGSIIDLNGNKDGQGTLARPDSKYYDIVYQDQIIDVREYAKVLNKWEVDLIRADKEENGIEEVVSFKYSDRNTGTLDTLTIAGGDRRRHYSTSVSSQHTSNKEIYTDSTQTIYAVNTVDSVAYKLFGVLYLTTGTYLDFDPSYGTTFTPSASSYTVLIVDKNTILSSNTKLSTDLIGNPTNYPQIMKDRLAEGKGIIGINPLLVDDLGNNLIQALVSPKIRSKSVISTPLSLVFQASGTSTWGTATRSINLITNVLFGDIVTTTNTYLLSYTSKNNPYTQTIPKSVVEVLPKVKASNSHSIYKGALVGNQVSGKIQVGNGSNGYEDKVLENIDDTFEYLSNNTSAVCTQNQTVVKVISGFLGTGGIIDTKYKYIGTTGTVNLTTTTYTNTSLWQNIGSLNTTPTHNTIVLDNANSPASKWFEVLEEGNNGVLAGVYGKELAYNVGTTSYDGDNELFDQLTNGTKTDINGKTVRTFHGSIAINGRIK